MLEHTDAAPLLSQYCLFSGWIDAPATLGLDVDPSEVLRGGFFLCFSTTSVCSSNWKLEKYIFGSTSWFSVGHVEMPSEPGCSAPSQDRPALPWLPRGKIKHTRAQTCVTEVSSWKVVDYSSKTSMETHCPERFG